MRSNRLLKNLLPAGNSRGRSLIFGRFWRLGALNRRSRGGSTSLIARPPRACLTTKLSCTASDASLLSTLVAKWDAYLRYGVPSTDPLDRVFDAVRYWRGPVWLVVNRLVADGFAAYGHTGLAERLRAESHQLALAHGLREYFNPITGEGLGGTDFSWSAAMWLAWAGKSGKDSRLTSGADLPSAIDPLCD